MTQSAKLNHLAPAPGFATKKISKEQLEKDIRFWQTVMEESHVNPYHAITKGEMQRLQRQVLGRLPDSLTHFEASFAISELIGSLDEGHLGFATNYVCGSLYNYHCIRFPYLLQDIDEGGFIVQRDLSSQGRLPAFSRIIEVNDVPAR